MKHFVKPLTWYDSFKWL